MPCKARAIPLQFAAMWYVYVLESEDKKWHYYGYTSNLKLRFMEHLNGEVTATRYHKPFKLRYYEAYDDESLARQREATLKRSRSATKAMMQRLNNSATKGA
ncbi:MAG TPA: GIY-YIG nuclease family protein [Candidatus Saccharimonadales bacterium]|nr:GIY-YIG nuclease family protein [Candidatus Saccharimonadales bacterium]